MLLDVIEHCQDPTTVLRHAHKAVCRRRIVIVTVPAIPWLFGPWDRALGINAGYTRQQLRQQAADADARTWLSGWNAFSLPPAIVVRVSRSVCELRVGAVPPGRAVDERDTLRMCKMRARLLRHVSLPCGLSLVGVFRT